MNVNKLFKMTIPTPLGETIAVASVSGLCLLEFSDRPGLEDELDRLSNKLNGKMVRGENQYVMKTEQELRAYFRDSTAMFTVPLSMTGTDFERAVWHAVREIPPGETCAYAQIAQSIGKPRAYRAVGRANGKNPVAIIVPCHRLVGADGKLHGYGGGLWRKEWLLEHERRS